MANIRSPFNFVPVSKKVYFPKEWSGVISQDIPFSDGVSGYIDLTITAKTPIFVRNGHTKSDAKEKNEQYLSFSELPDGRKFIPGSTIKGCVRNVLEILSFSKLHVDEEAMFAQREWDNPELYPLKKGQRSFHCGYLKEVDGKYFIEDHGQPYRIGHDELDKYIDNDEKPFRSHFSKNSGFDITKEHNGIDPKTALFKYQLVGGVNLKDLWFSEKDTTTEYSTRLCVDPDGDIHGSIVLTGQPDQWMWPRPTTLTKGAGKFYEFVFATEIIKEFEITEETFAHFKFIYLDSPDWKRAKSLINSTGIPVFFRLKGNTIKDFGLAYLYKLPYDKSPYEALPEEHRKDDMDLADCIFGKSVDGDSLKGRVQFGHVVSDNAELYSQDIIRLALGSPKASYYPTYIMQRNGNEGEVSTYSTYNDSTISGWKRYHVKKNIKPKCTDNDKIDTLMKPLNSGTEFNGKIRFHNLKEVELGALLSSLSFHNTEGCYHQIGQGKPYGFGKVQFSLDLHITSVNDKENEEKTAIKYMSIFERHMKDHVISNWNTCDQVRNLFTLAHEEVDPDDVLFQYMLMDTKDPKKNEFVSAKNNKLYLQLFTGVKETVTPESLIELADGDDKKKKELMLAALKDKADQAFANGLYEEAKRHYEEAKKNGLQCQAEILACTLKIQEGKKGLTDIIKFTKDAKIATVAGQMKKYLKEKELTEADCEMLGSVFQRNFSEMKKQEKVKWLEYKNWMPIVEQIGVKAEIIYKHILEQK